MAAEHVKQDSKIYFMFTKPQRVTTAMHSLEGLLKGIAIDGEISTGEVDTLKIWLEDNQDVLEHDPFQELKTLIDGALEDGRIDEDEKQDILWFCDKFTTSDNYYSAIISDIQRLHGILGGIISDNIIDKKELDGLRSWLDEHEHLKTCWPFDDIDALVTSVLEDGKIDEQEHEMMLNYFGEFFKFSNQVEATGSVQRSDTISGICAANPIILLPERSFCFTGSSKQESRENIKKILGDLGGTYSDKLDYDIDYLVIGADGSPCWTYACYGRKVEEAIQWQKEGSEILVVHEDDFWKAVTATE